MKRILATPWMVGLCLVATLACGDPSGDGDLTESRARFIDAYVDLRVEALRAEAEALTDSARAAVLDRHGITEEELLDFAETMGGDLDYMRDVWNEIEARLDSLPSTPDTL